MKFKLRCRSPLGNMGTLCVDSAALKVNVILLEILLNNEWYYLYSYLCYVTVV